MDLDTTRHDSTRLDAPFFPPTMHMEHHTNPHINIRLAWFTN